MKKIVVTGGSGFIGTNLVRALLELNHKVLVVEELDRHSDKFKNIENVDVGMINSIRRAQCYVKTFGFRTHPYEKNDIEVIKLASELVQIKSYISFSRNDFEIGTGSWKNTTILKDEIKIKANIFLFKE